jgi:uncharacterized membrane protein YjfL (UPF0719 family)
MVGSIFGYWFERSIDFVLISSLISVVGAILGLALNLVVGATAGDALFSWNEVLFCTLGALVCVLLFSVIHKMTPKHAAHEDHVEENPVDED